MICALVCVCVRGWPKEVSVKYANECITMTNEFCNGARWCNGGETQLHSECFNWVFYIIFCVFFFLLFCNKWILNCGKMRKMLAYHIRLVFKAFMVIREKGVRSVNQFSFALKGCDFGALTMTMIIVRRQQFLNATICCAFFFSQPTMAIYACGWMEWIHPHRRQWPIFNQFKFK